MPKITYIDVDGTAHCVEVPVGDTVMEGAVDNDVPGIDADCGGACACATCHVYIDPAWREIVGPVDPDSSESSMLGFSAVVREESRLSCQVEVTHELDGLVVRMPEAQH